MTVTATTSATTTTSTTTTDTGTTTISSDFETFLKMLTVQMENQDPLNPVDSADYAMQLATFSGVEQQVLTNDLLETMLTNMTTGNLSSMASWVGNEVRAASASYFDGSPITVAPNPASIADRVELIVQDADGNEVQRIEIPVSAEPVEWAGVSDDGTPFDSGLYSFYVSSYSGDETLMTEQAEVYSTVTEIRAEEGATILMLEGGTAVAASAVSGLRDPSLI